jgi:signal recognition particle receptor subunit beta
MLQFPSRHLHHVLHAITSLPPSHSPPLLILAHKVDLLRTLSTTPDSAPNLAITRVKTILERELEKRRVSQSNSIGIEGLGEEGAGTELGGLDCNGGVGITFKFDDWEGGDVNFFATWLQIQASASEKKDGLAPFTDWLEGLCNNIR